MAALPDETSSSPSSPPVPSSSKPASSGMSSGINSNASNNPPGHALRRTRTFNDVIPPPPKRRPSVTRSDASFDAPLRRSSNFSEYSFGEARDILYPQAQGATMEHSPESSNLASASLAFALLPALASVLFHNGGSVVTDIMLLGLAGVFLHWSVTQPWVWYHDAQQVRIKNEASSETIIDDNSDAESPLPSPNVSSPLDDVPEDKEPSMKPAATKAQKDRGQGRQMTKQQQSALKELYIYEVLALLSCFLLPLLSAYLLHAIRSQLSRPSEGLVSNYNLTIFLLVSELRVFSHMIKLVKSRTLHLQRLVHTDPFGTPATSEQLNDLVERLVALESSPKADDPSSDQSDSVDSIKAKQEAVMTRDVRNAIQPELDALNRAVRRYEKKATLLQLQTESRFASVDARLDDAIALAAAAAKNSSSQRNILKLAGDVLVSVLLFPFNALLQVLVLPLRAVLSLVKRDKHSRSAASSTRNSRPDKMPAQPQYNARRMAVRAPRR